MSFEGAKGKTKKPVAINRLLEGKMNRSI